MKKELNKYLNSLTGEELVQEIKKLYDKFEPVRKYYELELGDNPGAVLAEYKEQIKKEYFPNRGFGHARSSVSRKVISDFKKIAVHKKDVIELMLYRTEMMIAFSTAYGGIDEAFYKALCNGFAEACKLIRQERLEAYFKNYCQELVDKTYNFGWGVYDELAVNYREYLD